MSIFLVLLQFSIMGSFCPRADKGGVEQREFNTSYSQHFIHDPTLSIISDTVLLAKFRLLFVCFATHCVRFIIEMLIPCLRLLHPHVTWVHAHAHFPSGDITRGKSMSG